MTRNFSHRKATRGKMPLLVSLVGPSSSGKTKSGLRLARGFQRVTGGKVFGVDTEAGRMLQYAEEFDFEHVPFGAPFGPLDYLDVIKYCIDNGATTVIVDSLSHEHEGPGGILEMHQAEVQRIARGDASKFEKVKMLAWGRPKSEHRRFINTILQFNCNFVFCLRAKEKLDVEPGKQPVKMGFMPIGDSSWTYEMTMQALLLPGSRGVPTWQSAMPGEKETIKLPGQFDHLFASNPQLSEDIGEALARWAEGAAPTATMTAAQLIADFAACSEPSEFRRLGEITKASWSSLSKDDRPRVKAASEQCAKKIEDAAKVPEPEPVAEDDEFEQTAVAG